MSIFPKEFSSTDPGALVLSGTAASLSTLLKTYLADGRGLGAVQSISVSNGIATASYASGHPFTAGHVGLFDGAALEAINGEHRILSTGINFATFAVPDVPDGPVTGSITSKLAAAGWMQMFSVTSPAGVLVIKSRSIEGSGCFLRIDDSGTTTARVVGYGSMSDASVGSGAFPTDAQQAGGLYWPKSDAANSTARAWRLFADERFFMLWVSPASSNRQMGPLFGFGDIIADGFDQYGCTIFGSTVSNVVSDGAVSPGCLGLGNGPGAGGSGMFMPRSYTGVGGSVAARKVGAYNTAIAYSGTSSYSSLSIPYPNAADNSLRFSRVEIIVPPSGFRGVVPGLYHTPQEAGAFFKTGDLISGTGVFAGRDYRVIGVGPAPGNILGCAFVDLTSWDR
jgi:hypothetical protein